MMGQTKIEKKKRSMNRRWFRLDHGDDNGPPGLVGSTSNQAEINKLILAFKQQGIQMVEINADEASRIKRQQRRNNGCNND